jgi:hypothetical protein
MQHTCIHLFLLEYLSKSRRKAVLSTATTRMEQSLSLTDGGSLYRIYDRKLLLQK